MHLSWLDLRVKSFYQMIQKNSTIEYYNARICRASIDIKCVGVTHEYYDVPGGTKSSKFNDIYIDDIGDGGAKDDKGKGNSNGAHLHFEILDGNTHLDPEKEIKSKEFCPKSN